MRVIVLSRHSFDLFCHLRCCCCCCCHHFWKTKEASRVVSDLTAVRRALFFPSWSKPQLAPTTEIYGSMDERWHEEHDRLGPVRPRRPSQSLDYVGPSPQASPRPSTDLPYRFRSRRSMAKTRGASQLSQQLSPGASPSFRYSGETPTNGSERKASFRRAVRKLFGKKAGDQVSASQSSRSPPSHNYHRSVSTCAINPATLGRRADLDQGPWPTRCTHPDPDTAGTPARCECPAAETASARASASSESTSRLGTLST